MSTIPASPRIFKSLADEFSSEIIDFRRHLHANPELSFHEDKSNQFITQRLSQNNIDYTSGYARTGICARIGSDGPYTVLRADMDALPIQEETGLAFASTCPGVMHACGHDAHSAMVYGAGLILNRLAHSLPGRVALIFQPAEEKSPGGAKAMIDGGVFKYINPGSIFGQHVNPGLRTGTIGVRSGIMMAGVDDLIIRIHGQGGHAASPHLLADPVHASAQVLIALQSLVSRSSNPETPTVLSFGRIEALGAYNIIPDAVEISGTFRTTDQTWRTIALERIRHIAQSIATAFSCSADIQIIAGYPPVFNPSKLSNFVKECAIQFVGAQNVVDLPLAMWAEDFAYYQNVAPACFYNLGISPDPSDPAQSRPLHNARFMVDETAIANGASFLAYLAWHDLIRQKHE